MYYNRVGGESDEVTQQSRRRTIDARAKSAMGDALVLPHYHSFKGWLPELEGGRKMSELITCVCGKQFYKEPYENKPCPGCGRVARAASSGEQFLVTCTCGHQFYKYSYENKPCPNCGKIARA